MSPADAAELLARHEPLCWHLARRYGRDLSADDREDLAAAVRAQLVTCARTFDPGRGFRFTTYAYRLAVFKARSAARQLRAGGVRVPHNYASGRVVPRVLSADEARGADGARLIDLAVAPDAEAPAEVPADFWERCRAHLTDRQYQCLVLRYREGLSLQAAGDRIGRSKELVRSMCGSAVEKLRGLGVFDGLRGAV